MGFSLALIIRHGGTEIVGRTMCVIGHNGVRFLTNQKIIFCRIIKKVKKWVN